MAKNRNAPENSLFGGFFWGDTHHVAKIFFHFTIKKLIFNSKKDVVMRKSL
jgi:hypothetical protein